MTKYLFQALVGRACRLLSSTAIKAGGRKWTYRRMATQLTKLTEEENMMRETGTLCGALCLRHVIARVVMYSGKVCTREGSATGEGDG